MKRQRPYDNSVTFRFNERRNSRLCQRQQLDSRQLGVLLKHGIATIKGEN